MKILKIMYLLVVISVLGVFFLAENVFADFASEKVFLTFDADMTYHMRYQQEKGVVKQWYDPALIEYLKKNKIPATFFITGMFAEMYPKVVKGLSANSNFSIQNHTYDHRSFEPNCFGLPIVKTDGQKRVEIQKTQNILKALTGRVATYFRYPGLCHNVDDDAIVSGEGLLLAKGEISSGDAYMKNPEAIVNNVLSRLKRGHVIVFHMGDIKTPATTDAIKLLVPKLKDLGYTLGRL